MCKKHHTYENVEDDFKITKNNFMQIVITAASKPLGVPAKVLVDVASKAFQGTALSSDRGAPDRELESRRCRHWVGDWETRRGRIPIPSP